MTDDSTRAIIRAFIVENFLYTRPDFAFGDDDSLLRKGIFDSLGVMEVVGFIEERWELVVSPVDVVERNFGTISGMVEYVASRKLESGRPA